jgi:hypothetical protein
MGMGDALLVDLSDCFGERSIADASGLHQSPKGRAERLGAVHGLSLTSPGLSLLFTPSDSCAILHWLALTVLQHIW